MGELMSIKGIGEKTEQGLNKLGINTIKDLMEYYPRTYDIYEETEEPSLSRVGDTIAVIATVNSRAELVRNGKRIITRLKLMTEQTEITAIWFNMPFLKNTLLPNTKFVFRGQLEKVKMSYRMCQPEIIAVDKYKERLFSMQPIYSITKGITNKAIMSAIKNSLLAIDNSIEYLPSWIVRQADLVELDRAIKAIHFPANVEEMQRARARIAFDEFLLFQLSMFKFKEKREQTNNSYIIKEQPELEMLIDNLPYKLTNAQIKAIEEIKRDLGSDIVMNRLVQGDVGSGKTIVALAALLLVVRNGYQGAIMVPTEVLAKQHFKEFTELLLPFNIKVDIIVGSMSKKEKQSVYEKLKNGTIDIVVGTHALIQEGVIFNNLALVITDEQHRFGVKQRENLSNKGNKPHVLVMSATPIPRTLAIILYGDLDISVIDEMPPNRKKIKNCVVGVDYRPKAYDFIQKEVLEGRQAYVVCAMVEENEDIEAEAVTDYIDNLKKTMNKNVRIELLHGKMKPKDKTDIMERFSKGEIDIVVSTTVIEVGVNVPNATVMLIENAERFGLAQLHQLRGRVGRGNYQGYCIFINCKENDRTKKRLEVLSKSNDGFYIAEEDLKQRGPGDFFGIRQSGAMKFKAGDIYTDFSILKLANEFAKQIISIQNWWEQEEYKALINKIVKYGTEEICL